LLAEVRTRQLTTVELPDPGDLDDRQELIASLVHQT
jgi:hypothetical protein